MEDAEIITLLDRREESALDEIFHQYGRLLKSFAGRILPTAQDAEECVNDALLDIWNSIPPKRPASLAAYGATLARRRAIDRLRRMKAQKRGGGTYPAALDELSDCIPGDTTPGETDETAEALREALNDFLASLPFRDRLIFTGRYFAFESPEDLAVRNGITKNTVNIRLSRMRRKLKKHLEERGIFT